MPDKEKSEESKPPRKRPASPEPVPKVSGSEFSEQANSGRDISRNAGGKRETRSVSPARKNRGKPSDGKDKQPGKDKK